MNSRRLTFLALMVAMASVAHLLEGMLPPLFPALPGVKLGLANVFTLYVLLNGRWQDALLVAVARCLVTLLLSGAVIGFLYGLAGALTSFMAMAAGKRVGFSTMGISILGAVSHSTAQLAVAVGLTRTVALIGYLPWLLLCSLIAGGVVATLVQAGSKLIERGRVHHGR